MFPLIYNLQPSKNRHFTGLLFFWGEAAKLNVPPVKQSTREAGMNDVDSTTPSDQGSNNIINNYKMLNN